MTTTSVWNTRSYAVESDSKSPTPSIRAMKRPRDKLTKNWSMKVYATMCDLLAAILCPTKLFDCKTGLIIDVALATSCARFLC